MTRPRLFHWWQRLALLLFLVGLILQVLLLGGYIPCNVLGGHIPCISRATTATSQSSRIGDPRSVVKSMDRLPLIKKRPTFQTGVDFPQWGNNAYSNQDSNWRAGLQEIGPQTEATWIAMTIDFTQTSLVSTQVLVGSRTPSLQAFAQGIRSARAAGYSVFVQPLITVQGVQPWIGAVQFADEREAAAWFASFWHVYQPYIKVAAQAGANELALGTEFEHLQSWTVEWNQLIAQAHAIFPGLLTYDMNWSSLGLASYPSWMRNPLLAYIGVSTYIALTDVPERLPPASLPGLWRTKIGMSLDAFATTIHKQVLISEIGYRNSPDALYQPWEPQQLPGTDPQEQAAAYDAALQNILVDPHLAGVFFWAWSLPPYAPNGEPAATILLHWYYSPMA